MDTEKATSTEADEWMTLPQACAALGDSRTKVFTAILDGLLVSKRMAAWTFVRRDSVLSELERRKASAAETEVTTAQ